MATFLATHRLRGRVAVTGPVTGLDYTITPGGTPVSDFDVEEMLRMTGPPCCGISLPFGGQVKLFGKIAATARQLQDIPIQVLTARPMAEPEAKPKEEHNGRDILHSRISSRSRRVSSTAREPSPSGDSGEVGEPGDIELDVLDLRGEHRPSGGEVD